MVGVICRKKTENVTATQDGNEKVTNECEVYLSDVEWWHRSEVCLRLVTASGS